MIFNPVVFFLPDLRENFVPPGFPPAPRGFLTLLKEGLGGAPGAGDGAEGEASCGDGGDGGTASNEGDGSSGEGAGELVNPERVLAVEARVQEEPQEAVGGQAMELVEEQSGRGYQLPLHQGTEVEAKALRLRVLAEEAQVREVEPREAVGDQAMELVEEQSGRGYQLPLHQGTEVEVKALRLQVLAEEAQVREGDPRESVGGQAMELEGEHRKLGADQGVVVQVDRWKQEHLLSGSKELVESILRVDQPARD